METAHSAKETTQAMETSCSEGTSREERAPQATQKKSGKAGNLAKCLLCNCVFHDVKQLINHYKEVHGANECTCPTCSNTSTNHNLLTKVEISREGNEKIMLCKCKMCQEIFPAYCKCLEHCNTAHLQRPFECGSCQQTYAKLKDLHMHLRVHDSRSVKVVCGYCKKTFHSVQTLNVHVSKHKKDRVVEDRRNSSSNGKENQGEGEKVQNEKEDVRDKGELVGNRTVQTLNVHGSKHKKDWVVEELDRRKENQGESDTVQNEKEDVVRNNEERVGSHSKKDEDKDSEVHEKATHGEPVKNRDNKEQNKEDNVIRNNTMKDQGKDTNDNFESKNDKAKDHSNKDTEQATDDDKSLQRQHKKGETSLAEDKQDRIVKKPGVKLPKNMSSSNSSTKRKNQNKNDSKCNEAKASDKHKVSKSLGNQTKNSENSLSEDKQGRIVKKPRGIPPKNVSASSPSSAVKDKVMKRQNKNDSKFDKTKGTEPQNKVGKSVESQSKSSENSLQKDILKKRRGRLPKNASKPTNTIQKSTKKHGKDDFSNTKTATTKQSKPGKPMQSSKSSEVNAPHTSGYCCIKCIREFRTKIAYENHMVVYHCERPGKRKSAVVKKSNTYSEDTDDVQDKDDQYPGSVNSSDSLSSSSSDSEFNVDPFSTGKSQEHPTPGENKKVAGQKPSSSKPVSSTKEAAAEMIDGQTPNADESPLVSANVKGGKTKRIKGRLMKSPRKRSKLRIVSDDENDDAGLSASMKSNRSLFVSTRVTCDFPPSPDVTNASDKEPSNVGRQRHGTDLPETKTSPHDSSDEEQSTSVKCNRSLPEIPALTPTKDITIANNLPIEEDSNSGENNRAIPDIPDITVPQNITSKTSQEERSHSEEGISPEIPVLTSPEIPVLTPPQVIDISDDEKSNFGDPNVLTPQTQSISTNPQYNTALHSGHSQLSYNHRASTSFTHSSPDTAVWGNQIFNPQIMISNVCSIPHRTNAPNSSDPRFAQSSNNPPTSSDPRFAQCSNNPVSNSDPRFFQSGNQQAHSSGSRFVPSRNNLNSMPVQQAGSPTFASSTSSIPVQRGVSPAFLSTSATSSIPPLPPPPPMQMDPAPGTPMCVRCWRQAYTTHVCEFCGIIFMDVDIYTLHKLIHDRDNPYKCTGCGKVFASKYQFTSHIFRDPHP